LASPSPNCILLESYYLPNDLEAQVEAFIEHNNHQRCDENIKNTTPAYAYFIEARSPLNIKQ
tara:strand:- start:63335 stop:63520 length:186 start_codon:yes stop_codon:yes gene_type:complete